jgi:hypothetical protein
MKCRLLFSAFLALAVPAAIFGEPPPDAKSTALKNAVKRLVARQNLAASAEDTGVPMMIGRSF